MSKDERECNHTGFESNVCGVCGYPDPSKMIAALKKQIEAGECCGNCKHYTMTQKCYNMRPGAYCSDWESDGLTRKDRE